MDVFRLHDQAISDSSAFARPFVDIEDKRITEEVAVAIEQVRALRCERFAPVESGFSRVA